MSFMDIDAVTDPDVLEAATYEAPGSVMGVWVQTDTWDTHVFVLAETGDRFHVGMFNIHQERKGRRVRLAEIEEHLSCEAAYDEAEASELSEALELVANGWQTIEFAPGEIGDRLRAELEGSRETEKLENMSKYARKVYLRERGES